MIFKEIKPNDEEIIKELIEIEKENFGVNGGADNWLMKTFVRYGLLLVLMEDDNIISVAEFIQVIGKKELFLYGFLTREAYRNKGYGKKLLAYSEERAKDFGIEKIILTVDPKNKEGILLYKSSGYEVVEFQKDEYGVGVDRYLMSKLI